MQQDGRARRRALIAGVVGHAIENYDFAVYGLMASVIAPLFFPAADPNASLLAAFGGLAIGYVMRPIGGLIFGPLGDRFGRRIVLILTVSLMSLGTLVMGLLPTYATAGVAASAALLGARLIQGFATGGEFSGSTTFIAESAPAHARGLWASGQQVSTVLGVLAASAVAGALASNVSADVLERWAWRVPFLFAFAGGLVALYLRFSVPETPYFREMEANSATSPRIRILSVVGAEWPAILRIVAVALLFSVAYHSFFIYNVSLVSGSGLPLADALGVNTLSLILMLFLIPAAGHVSDRCGRKPLLIASSLGFAALSYPLFLLIEKGEFQSYLCAQVLFALLLAMFAGPAPAFMAEILHTRTRSTVMAIGYGVALMAFGGTTPLIQTYAALALDNDAAGALWVIAAAIGSFVGIAVTPETVKRSLELS